MSTMSFSMGIGKSVLYEATSRFEKGEGLVCNFTKALLVSNNLHELGIKSSAPFYSLVDSFIPNMM